MLQKIKLWSRENKTAVLLVLSILMILLLPFLYTRDYFNGYGHFYDTSAANIGQTIGGITAPFVGLLGAWLLYQTLMAQVKESKSNEQSRVLDRLDKYLKEPLETIKAAAKAAKAWDSFSTINCEEFRTALEDLETIFSTKIYTELTTKEDQEVHLFKSVLSNSIERHCIDFIHKNLQQYVKVQEKIVMKIYSKNEMGLTDTDEKKFQAQLDEFLANMNKERNENIPKDLIKFSADKEISEDWVEKLYRYDTDAHPRLLEKEENLLKEIRKHQDQEIAKGKFREISLNTKRSDTDREIKESQSKQENINSNFEKIGHLKPVIDSYNKMIKKLHPSQQ